MFLVGLADLLVALGLFVFLVSSAVPFLRRRVAPVGRAARGRLVASLTVTGLFVLLNVVYINGFGTDPVIGSPTVAQVTGTWVGSGGATLVLRPDGTFTASRLPRMPASRRTSPSWRPGGIRPLATAPGSSPQANSMAARRA